MKKDFVSSEVTSHGSSGMTLKPASWTGIRYMISEVSSLYCLEWPLDTLKTLSAAIFFREGPLFR